MVAKIDLRNKAKALWIRGMKAVGNTAASIANNTRYKVDEVTIQNRRREVIGDLASKAYALWLKGEKFPEQMTGMLEELKHLDEQLNDMRAEKYALSGKAAVQDISSGEAPMENEDPDDEEDEDDGAFVIPGDDSPVRSQINDLFDGTSSVDKMADKVNNTLEQMSERIRCFPDTNTDEDKQE